MGKIYDKMVEHWMLSFIVITIVAAGGGLLLGYILKQYCPEAIDIVSVGMVAVAVLILLGVFISIQRDNKRRCSLLHTDERGFVTFRLSFMLCLLGLGLAAIGFGLEGYPIVTVLYGIGLFLFGLWGLFTEKGRLFAFRFMGEKSKYQANSKTNPYKPFRQILALFRQRNVEKDECKTNESNNQSTNSYVEHNDSPNENNL